MSFWPGDGKPGSPVSEAERAMMEADKELGLSIRQIAADYCRSPNTVARVLNPAARERDRIAVYMGRHGVPYSRPKLGTLMARKNRFSGPRESSRDQIFSAFEDDPSMFLELGFDSIAEGWEAFDDMDDAELEEYA